jgi:hypothetical protein
MKHDSVILTTFGFCFTAWIMSMQWAYWHFNEHWGEVVVVGVLTLVWLSIIGYSVFTYVTYGRNAKGV